ncbi:hypothetical protein D2E80_14435 [Mycobacteroides abscessus]|nr:hypothetical protein D2E80_14435 [Mycobacteroides abscessus]
MTGILLCTPDADAYPVVSAGMAQRYPVISFITIPCDRAIQTGWWLFAIAPESLKSGPLPGVICQAGVSK